jgi:lipid-A-disaccharide synthase
LKKKIFIITGESSGDKLASNIVPYFNPLYFDIIAIGSEHLKKKGIKLFFNSSQISVMGFFDVLKKVFFFNNKINQTINCILKFKPDVIFSIDSPDFSFRIEKIVKNKLPRIKIVHLVAPSIWAWREGRAKYFRKFLDHILLLFPFEKRIFNKWKIKNTYVGHPFFEKNIIYKNLALDNNKKIISLCPGSRTSEIKTFMPIFSKLINKINTNYSPNFLFHFPVLKDHAKTVKKYIPKGASFVISSTEDVKNFYINKSTLAVAKSGTISLDVCKNKCPLITIYKTSWFNYFLIKPFVKIKYANIINIIANKQIIPELIQSECNDLDIFRKVIKFLDSKKQRILNVTNYQKIIKKITKKNSSKIIANIIKGYI